MSDQTLPPPAEPAPQPPAEQTPPPPAEQPLADPWAPPGPMDPWGMPAAPEILGNEPAPRRRPDRGTVVRWAAAVLVLALTASATAYAVTLPDRTDLPGLATPNDGRYVFPTLALPQLPAGRTAATAANSDHRHYADLRALVLPAPKGAVTETPAATSSSAAPSASPSPSTAASSSPSVSSATAAAGGPQPTAPWVPCADYAKLHDDSAHLPVLLQTNACRSASTRAWTAKDGTRTEIWLLRFGSKDEGRHFYDAVSADGSPKSVPDPVTGVSDYVRDHDGGAYTRGTTRTGPRNDLPVGHVVYLDEGDVVVTVLMTNPAGVPDQALHQVVTLQSDLLR